MITFTESGYTLRQIKGTNIVYITTPDQDVKKVIGKLTKDNCTQLILSIGR